MRQLESLWLANGLGFGAPGAGALFALCGDVHTVYQNRDSAEVQALLAPRQRKALLGTEPADCAKLLDSTKNAGIDVVCYDDEAYPLLLRHIPTPPPVLFCRGNTALLNGHLLLGMVGTRRPSAYGTEVVKTIGRVVAGGGAVIVSGLAAGLDSEAHKAALAESAPTIACIAFGHDQCYPSANRNLKETIVASGGLLVGEYPLGTEPEKVFFLQRNRLIAGLSQGTLVTEARRHSGTMSTVNFAAEFGRDVFAVPGSIYSELSSGTNALVREGAYLAAGADDVLRVYGLEGEAGRDDKGRPVLAALDPPAWVGALPAGDTAPFSRQLTLDDNLGTPIEASGEEKAAPPIEDRLAELSAPAKKLYTQLGPRPKHIEVLCEEAKLPVSTALAALFELEMEGLCEQQAGRHFIVKP